MRKYVFIALGGALGAVLRVAVKNIDLNRYSQNIPVNTLLINICGSFLLALILTISYDHLSWHPDIRLGITTGFIGAFTTFSTMSKEISLLILSGNYFYAVFYALLSVFLGLAAAWTGVRLAQRIDARDAGKGGTRR